MEDRPIAAKHKEKDKAFQTCAKNVRAAAARDPDPLIQNRGRYVNRDNLQNRMKTLKKKHEDDDRRSLRSSGSAEEYTERQQQMNALVEAWNGADLAAAEGRALTAAQLKQRSLNGKSLQGALFAQAAKAQVLKKRGQAHAQQLGVWDYTIVKESTRRPTVTQRLEMADRALEEGRSSKDALGAYEDQFDKAISALEQAITADGTATKAQDERLAALENGTAGMNARMDELSGLLQRFMNMFATRGDSAKRKRE